MEAVVAKSLSFANTSKPLSRCTTSTSITSTSLQCKTSLFAYQSSKIVGFRKLKLQCIGIIKPLQQRKVGVVFASVGGTSQANVAQGWLLEPVGDGDYKHIGFKVARPGAYEIFSSDEMVVGREPEKADLVIPVATVSGLHARIQNKEEVSLSLIWIAQMGLISMKNGYNLALLPSYLLEACLRLGIHILQYSEL